jgi:hypothetical protein
MPAQVGITQKIKSCIVLRSIAHGAQTASMIDIRHPGGVFVPRNLNLESACAKSSIQSGTSRSFALSSDNIVKSIDLQAGSKYQTLSLKHSLWLAMY